MSTLIKGEINVKYMKKIIYPLIIVLLIISIPQLVSAEAPNKPTNLKLRQAGNTTIEVFWTAPEGNGLEYIVTVTGGAIVTNQNPTDTFEEITELKIGDKYTVQVRTRVKNGEEYEYSDVISKDFTINNYQENGETPNPTDLQLLTSLN